MKKKIAAVLVLIFFGACKKSPYIEAGEIEELTGNSVTRLIEVRSYDLSEASGTEQAALYESNNNAFVSIFQKDGSEYILLRSVSLGEFKPLKMIFINPGLDYSHIVLLCKSEDYTLWLIDSKSLAQKIKVEKKDIERIFIDKKEDKSEENLRIGDISYRYDSFSYAPLNLSRPLFFLEKVEINGENSWIVIKNKGAFTGSAMITIGFPDVKAGEVNERVRLVADIPTVHYYAPGSNVFQKGGGRVDTVYPMIEVEKIPFGSFFSMKLPLFLDNPGRIYIRIAYKYRGATYFWPSEIPDDENTQVKKTQQGFLAYEYRTN